MRQALATTEADLADLAGRDGIIVQKSPESTWLLCCPTCLK
jgi:hypothetical protein